MPEEQTASFNFDVLPSPNGPDGKTWIEFRFGSGPLSQSVTVPEAVAEQIIGHASNKGTQVCASVRRANLGLLIGKPIDLRNLNGGKSG